MSEEILQPSAESNQGLDSSLSILVAESAAFNIDPTVDTLFTLVEGIASVIENPATDDEARATAVRCRDQLCAILFELDALQLGPIVELPLVELQSHLMTLSIGTTTDASIEVTGESDSPATTIDLKGAGEDAPPLSSPRAQEYWSAATRITDPLNEGVVGRDLSNRLATYLHVTASEAELSETIRASIESFWETRDSAIRGLLKTSNGKVTLSNEALERAGQFEAQYKDRLPDNRLSISAMVSSLRHHLTKKNAGYSPLGLFDTATLLLFLSEEANETGKICIVNTAPLFDLLILCFQMQRWRAEATDPLQFSECAALETILPSIRQSLTLMAGLHEK